MSTLIATTPRTVAHRRAVNCSAVAAPMQLPTSTTSSRPCSSMTRSGMSVQ
nr:hypothetical protein [Mycobacterium sp.]